MGPVQVLVVGFEQATPTGEVLAELHALRDAGIVRLIDVLLVRRDHDGTLEVLPPPTELPGDPGGLAASVLGQPGDSGDHAEGLAATRASGSTWSLADAIPLGTTAAVALIEHMWAAPLRAAIQRAGGSPLDETWLAGEDLALLEDMLVGERPD